MAQTQIKTVTEQKAATPPTPENETTAEVTIKTTGPAQLTFSELLGSVVTNVLNDPVSMLQAKKDITIWYNAQDPNTRSETAKKGRADLERSRGVIESAYQHFRELTFQEQ